MFLTTTSFVLELIMVMTTHCAYTMVPMFWALAEVVVKVSVLR